MVSITPALFEWTATVVAIALLLLCAWHNKKAGYKPVRTQTPLLCELDALLAGLAESTADETAAEEHLGLELIAGGRLTHASR